jgi:hypothetical protein
MTYTPCLLQPNSWQLLPDVMQSCQKFCTGQDLDGLVTALSWISNLTFTGSMNCQSLRTVLWGAKVVIPTTLRDCLLEELHF